MNLVSGSTSTGDQVIFPGGSSCASSRTGIPGEFPTLRDLNEKTVAFDGRPSRWGIYGVLMNAMIVRTGFLERTGRAPSPLPLILGKTRQRRNWPDGVGGRLVVIRRQRRSSSVPKNTTAAQICGNTHQTKHGIAARAGDAPESVGRCCPFDRHLIITKNTRGAQNGIGETRPRR